MPTYRFYFLLLFVFLFVGCSSTAPLTTTAEEPPAAVPTETAATEPASEETEEADNAPAGAPEDWFHQDAGEAPYEGVSTRKAYQTLLAGKRPAKKVIVAVLDSGIDIAHEDLSNLIWTNSDEVPGNRVDDDGNGYVDDRHGWNFIGGSDGRNVSFDTFETTRELAKLKPKYEDADPAQLTGEAREEYAYYLKVKHMYEASLEEMQTVFANLAAAEQAVEAANGIVAEHLGTETFTTAQVAAINPDNATLQQAQGILLYIADLGLNLDMIRDQKTSIEGRIEYGLNLDFNPRDLVGDNYDDPMERHYGNNDVAGPDPYHGTHVAGIIAADRTNEIGIKGIADHVEIMVLRTVPDGDERDKDVANAIHYAVDNGAHIINMSFGKDLSPEKEVVDAAVRYAVENNVLLVHGAGNDGANIDTTSNYPSRYYLGDTEAATWLEVGASSWEEPDRLAALFSNYGQEQVDLFAPGVSIFSTVPDQGYERADGTSMAAPVVAGVAALVMAYYPDLSAEQVRQILLQSVVSHAGQQVLQPGSDELYVDFKTLSRTGGIVNAYEALKLAEKMNP